MKRFFRELWVIFGCVLLAPLGVVHAAEGAVVLDRVVAVVNSEVVLQNELTRACGRDPLWQEVMAQASTARNPAQLQQKQQEARAKVLDKLIDRALIREEAAKFQISVTDEDVERALPNVANQYGLTVEQLKAQVEESGEYGTWQDYRNELRDDILVYKATNYLASWTVSDAQVREAYRKLARGETGKAEVERFTITPADTSQPAKDQAIMTAQTVATRLQNGDAPAVIAKELGLPETTAITLSRGEIAPALEDAIFAAKVGDIVGPLPSGQGYWVVQVKNLDTTAALSFEAAKDKLRQQLEMDAFIKAEQEFKQKLRAKAHIDLRLS